MPRFRTLLATAVVAGAVLAVPTSTLARDGDVIRTGDCSGSADWKLKAGLRDGGMELEFEVDSNRVGQTWRVRILDNGVERFAGLRDTTAPSGSFTVKRGIRNLAGPDEIVARARNVKSGQVCVAKLTL